LADAEWGKLSSRAIADMCGVSDMFVGTVRKASTANGLQCSAEKRTAKDGRQMPASNPKPKAEVVETVYEDAEPPEPTPQATAAPDSPQALVAHLHAAGTQLDKLRREMLRLSELNGGQWLEIDTIQNDFVKLKHKIKSAGYWLDCPDCNGKGKGCNTCNQLGWLSVWGKQRLTQAQKDKLGIA